MANIKTGDILDYSYTGAVQTITLPKAYTNSNVGAHKAVIEVTVAMVVMAVIQQVLLL